MMETRLQNLAAILANLDARGVKYKLVRGSFAWAKTSPPLTPELAVALDVCRPGLTWAMRIRAGVCESCAEMATRPKHRNRHERARWCESCFLAMVTPVAAMHNARKGTKPHAAGNEDRPETPTDEGDALDLEGLG